MMLMNIKWTKKELSRSKQVALVVGIILSIIGFGLLIPSLYVNDVGKVLASITFAIIGIFFIWASFKSVDARINGK